jgi:hypothetical protein
MAMTSAERQREYRRRQAAGRSELALLRGEIARLEADLEQALQAPAVPRCEDCGTPLACPACHGSDSA